MSDPFVAEIRIFGFNFAPRGWAFCNGQLMPISQNTALFSLLGVTYGGDGKSTFALPNMQGNAPMHPGQGPGLSLHDLGETGGTETITLLQTEMAQHGHSVGAQTVPLPIPPAIRSAAPAAATSTSTAGPRQSSPWLRRQSVSTVGGIRTTTCNRILRSTSALRCRASFRSVRRS